MQITQGLVADFHAGNLTMIQPFPNPTQISTIPVAAMNGQYLRGVGSCFAIASHRLVLEDSPMRTRQRTYNGVIKHFNARVAACENPGNNP